MSISDKITRLQTAKTNIATAITNKGGTVNSGDGFEDFAEKIASLSSAETETPNTITANGTYTATSGKYWTGVTVAVPVQLYYTGDTEPSSSLGNDGDLYFKEE